MKDKTLEKAAETAVEVVTENTSWFTPKRLLVAGLATLAVATTAFIVVKVRAAKESGEDKDTED